jgi:hypothetical protein
VSPEPQVGKVGVPEKEIRWRHGDARLKEGGRVAPYETCRAHTKGWLSRGK